MVWSVSLQAQESAWSAGPLVFLGQSKFTTGDAPSEYNNKFAWQLGGFGQYQTKGRLSFRVGLAYAHAQGGYKGQDPDITFPGLPPIKGDRYEAQFERTDIMLPLELHIKLGKKKEEGLYLMAGPVLAFALEQLEGRVRYVAGVPEGYGLQPVSEYKKVELFGSLGIGYFFKLNQQSRFFIQPMLSSNIPGNVLDFLGNEKGGPTDNNTVYWYGGCFGAVRKF